MSRPTEEKLWESKFRHNFFTNYLQDPDLHVLMFISESETSNIIREALRDWMTKHGCIAANPEFQAKVFIAASTKVAAGYRPVGSEIMEELGESRFARAAPPPAKAASPRKKTTRTQAPLSAQVLPAPVPPQVEQGAPTYAPPPTTSKIVEVQPLPTEQPAVQAEVARPAERK
ncbi:MAG: hypothetical protein K2W93_04225, partial [Burkholderiaceae bacterium]|nr:hypothetical protein [Burkholderiaceae bacterium]